MSGLNIHFCSRIRKIVSELHVFSKPYLIWSSEFLSGTADKGIFSWYFLDNFFLFVEGRKQNIGIVFLAWATI